MIDNLSALGGLSLRPFGGTDVGASPGAAVAPAGSASFAAMLGSAATEAVSTLRGAESVSAAGLRGEADARQVVDAVMEAEQTLQAAVAIRDKIVSAYLEISRMAI